MRLFYADDELLDLLYRVSKPEEGVKLAWRIEGSLFLEMGADT